MRVTSATLLLPPLCFCINCPLERVALDLLHLPPTQFSSPIHGLLTADRQCLGGREIRVRGMGYSLYRNTEVVTAMSPM